MSFPAIVHTLMEAGFEGYEVNYRTGAQAFYLPDGSSVALPAHSYEGPVNAAFDAAGMETLVRWAQSGEPAYSYPVFSEPAKRSEEHTSELQSLMRISYAVFCLTKKKKTYNRCRPKKISPQLNNKT